MDPLTFTVPNEGTSHPEILLTTCSSNAISESMWEELAAHLAAANTLIPYPASILAQRCQEGYSAVVICDGHIVSHISLAPIVERAPGKHSWSIITQALGIQNPQFPSLDVYEFTSSWTNPAFRGKHISLILRSPLIERWFTGNTLGISGMLGLASPILARLGWNILAWDAAPFVNSLIAVPGDGFLEHAAYAWCIPAGIKLYQGPHLPLDHPAHQVERYHYCWVSNPVAAQLFNQELSAMVDGDLARWRTAIVSGFCRPESTHKLVFIS